LNQFSEKKFEIIHEPKKKDFGKPDFIVRKNNLQIEFIETKDIGIDLDKNL